jgi:hypothetical protein
MKQMAIYIGSSSIARKGNKMKYLLTYELKGVYRKELFAKERSAQKRKSELFMRGADYVLLIPMNERGMAYENDRKKAW